MRPGQAVRHPPKTLETILKDALEAAHSSRNSLLHATAQEYNYSFKVRDWSKLDNKCAQRVIIRAVYNGPIKSGKL